MPKDRKIPENPAPGTYWRAVRTIGVYNAVEALCKRGKLIEINVSDTTVDLVAATRTEGYTQIVFHTTGGEISDYPVMILTVNGSEPDLPIKLIAKFKTLIFVVCPMPGADSAQAQSNIWLQDRKVWVADRKLATLFKLSFG